MMPQRPLVNRAARRNKLLALTLYALGGVFALAGLAAVAEIVFGAGLLTGFAVIDAPILAFLVAGAAFGLGYQVHRRIKVLTRCKRCGGRLQLVGVRDSNPRDPSEGYTEYTYACTACGAQITMVEA